MDEKQIWLLQTSNETFWRTHDLTFEDNRLLAWLGSSITDCSQFVHLRAPEPAALPAYSSCWGSATVGIHLGPELSRASSALSSEMFYYCLLQHPRTVCVDKSWALFEMASMAMKLSRIDFREVSAHEYLGVREPRPLLYCKLVLVLCFWHGPMKENKNMIWYLDNFINWVTSWSSAFHCIVCCLPCCQHSYVVRIGGLALFPRLLPFSYIFC